MEIYYAYYYCRQQSESENESKYKLVEGWQRLIIALLAVQPVRQL